MHIDYKLMKGLIIITNAGLGWVELTSMRFFPKLHKSVIMNADKYGIKIISAREMFE